MFAQQGAKVAITGRNKLTLDKAVKEIGFSALAIQGDVSKSDDLSRIYQTVKENFGNIDILVANAGVYVLSPLPDFTEAMFDTVSDINFKGVFFTVQKALTALNDGASVILVSSTKFFCRTAKPENQGKHTNTRTDRYTCFQYRYFI